MLRIILAALFVTLCPCFQAGNSAAAEPSPRTLSLPKSGLVVGVQLEEYGEPDSRKISIEPMFEPVNPDATLVVSFPPPQGTLLLQGYPEWEQLEQLVTTLNALAESRKRHTDLILAVDSGQQEKLSEFEDSSEKFDDQYDAMDDQARKVLGEQVYAALDTKAVNLSSTGIRFVDILSEWIKSRREELSRQTAGIIINAKSSATVSIQVFHISENGATKVLHVDPYDNIPAGNLTSNPKTELGLSASEYAQLSKGYELSNSVAQGITQFGQSIKDIQDKLHSLADTINKQLLAFANSFEDKGKLWQERIEKTDLLIANLAKGPEPVAGKAKALQLSIVPVREDVKKILVTISAIRSLQSQLRGKGLSMALFSQGTSIGVDVDTLITNSKKWPEQTKDIQNKMQDLAVAVAATEKHETLADLDQLKSDILAQINKSREEIEALIPDGFNALLVEARRVTEDTRKNEKVYHEMATANCETIPHNLDALVPGIIKLKPAGVNPGDELKVRVTLANPATLEEKILEYRLKIRYVGLHMGYSGQLVFVAPIKGVNKNAFQASAAVLGTWKYGVEKPVGLKKLWYRMDPGWGVHVMALNQGSGTTETGLGFSGSLWGDLVTLGYGWNVGIKGSPPYYFIGVGLLELLQQFRKINPSGQ